MNIDMEYSKGILFVRINGNLIRKNVIKFEEQIIPIILKAGIKFLTLNLENLNSIDEKAVESFSKIYDIIRQNKGKVSFCNMNDSIKLQINKSEIKDKFYNTDNEKTAMELFEL